MQLGITTCPVTSWQAQREEARSAPLKQRGGFCRGGNEEFERDSAAKQALEAPAATLPASHSLQPAASGSTRRTQLSPEAGWQRLQLQVPALPELSLQCRSHPLRRHHTNQLPQRLS